MSFGVGKELRILPAKCGAHDTSYVMRMLEILMAVDADVTENGDEKRVVILTFLQVKQDETVKICNPN